MVRKPKVDLEMAQFQADLLQSVREMKAGTFARSTQVPVTEALQARAKMDLPPSQFAKLQGVSVRTLQ
jgi:putative transcriptional regulator